MNRFSALRFHLTSLFGLFMLARQTDNVRYVFMLGNAQDSLAESARARSEMRDPFADPDLEALWRERYAPPPYDIKALARLDPATLGGAYARHMQARGLRPDYYTHEAPRHKLHYLRLRIHQTHDIWHMLTGFGTDPAGEVGLQAFNFAQFTNGQAAMILAGAILKSVLQRRYAELEKFVEAFCEGFRKGRRARPLLGVKWEEQWEERVDDLRRRFQIEPAS